MSDRARAQFLHGLEPIVFGRALGAAASIPTFISESGDVVVSKSGDSVTNGRLIGMPLKLLFAFELLTRVFTPAQMLLFAM